MASWSWGWIDPPVIPSQAWKAGKDGEEHEDAFGMPALDKSGGSGTLSGEFEGVSDVVGLEELEDGAIEAENDADGPKFAVPDPGPRQSPTESEYGGSELILAGEHLMLPQGIRRGTEWGEEGEDGGEETVASPEHGLEEVDESVEASSEASSGERRSVGEEDVGRRAEMRIESSTHLGASLHAAPEHRVEARASMNTKRRRRQRQSRESAQVQVEDVRVEILNKGFPLHKGVPHSYLADKRMLKGSGRLLPDQVRALKLWVAHEDHWAKPYPSEDEKGRLAAEHGMTMTQVSDWFRNERKRVWLPIKRLREMRGLKITDRPVRPDEAALPSTARRAADAAGATALASADLTYSPSARPQRKGTRSRKRFRDGISVCATNDDDDNATTLPYPATTPIDTSTTPLDMIPTRHLPKRAKTNE